MIAAIPSDENNSVFSALFGRRVAPELIQQCAWCNRIISGPFKGTKFPEKLKNASHGVCDPCVEEQWEQHCVQRIKKLAQGY